MSELLFTFEYQKCLVARLACLPVAHLCMHADTAPAFSFFFFNISFLDKHAESTCEVTGNPTGRLRYRELGTHNGDRGGVEERCKAGALTLFFIPIHLPAHNGLHKKCTYCTPERCPCSLPRSPSMLQWHPPRRPLRVANERENTTGGLANAWKLLFLPVVGYDQLIMGFREGMDHSPTAENSRLLFDAMTDSATRGSFSPLLQSGRILIDG